KRKRADAREGGQLMAWHVQLAGDKGDLAALAESLTATNLAVRPEGEEYELHTDRFADDDAPTTVLEKAQSMVELLTGAARLALGAREPIRVGTIYRERVNGGRDVFAFPPT